MDYSKAKIYKIINTQDDEVYIGSTTQPLNARFRGHKCRWKEGITYRLYQHMSKCGVDEFSIELVEEYPCANKQELRSREGEWIKSLGTLNDKQAGRSTQEYREDNAERIKEWHKRWTQEHKEHVYQRKKQWVEENKEATQAYMKEYHERNKDRIDQRLTATLTCECGCKVAARNIAKHKRTEKHISKMKNISA